MGEYKLLLFLVSLFGCVFSELGRFEWKELRKGMCDEKSSYEKPFPGSRYNGGSFFSQKGVAYIFGGGFGYSERNLGYLSDVFGFSKENLTFTFISGSRERNEATSITSISGEYSQYPSNRIGSRQNPLCWVDEINDPNSPELYTFGGKGVDVNENVGLLNDLFISLIDFDLKIAYITMIGGSMERNTVGIYEPSNTYPGSRYMSHSWKYNSNVYIFGGFGYGMTASKGSGYLNDLFNFDLTTKTFKFLQGSKDVVKVEDDLPDVTQPPYISGAAAFKVENENGMISLLLFGGMTTNSHYVKEIFIFEGQDGENEFQYRMYNPKDTNSKWIKHGLHLPIVMLSSGSVMLFGGRGLCDDDNERVRYHSSLYYFSVSGLPVCGGLNSSDVLVCSGHGICVDDEACKCEENYEGEYCDQRSEGQDSFNMAMFSEFGVMDILVLVFLAAMVCGCVCTSLFCLSRRKMFGGGGSFSHSKEVEKGHSKSLSMSPENKGVFLDEGNLEEFLLQSEDEDGKEDTIIMMKQKVIKVGSIEPGPPNSPGPGRPHFPNRSRPGSPLSRKGKKKLVEPSLLSDTPILSKEIRTFEINSRDYMLGRVIGRGRFSQSTVHNAVLRGESVVVKLFTGYPCDFLRTHVLELSLMLHPNIPYFYGFSIHSEVRRKSGSIIGRKMETASHFNEDVVFRLSDPLQFSVCLEYCELKDIKSYWERNSPRFLGLQDQIEILIHVARAIMYLHANSVYHGHVTSANVLLDKKAIGKLDVSRICRKEMFVDNDKRELQYFPPEYFSRIGKSSSRNRLEFEEGVAGDLYAFAIVMYEILTQDFHLYESLRTFPPTQEEMLGRLQNDPLFRPVIQRNEHGGNDKELLLYEILERCWDYDPENRMCAREIVKKLKEVKKAEEEVMED